MTRDLQSRPDLPEIWIVFSGQTDLPWLKCLKPGFRHCYAVVNDGKHWITYDPLSHFTDVNVHALPLSFDLPGWLSERNLTVVKAPVVRIQKQAPWMPYSCVEALKRLIGLHSMWIVTPWQLYSHLQKVHQTHTDIENFNQSKGDLAWEV